MNNHASLSIVRTNPIDLPDLPDQMGVDHPHARRIESSRRNHSTTLPDNPSNEEISTRQKSVGIKFNKIMSQNAELRYDNELLVEKLDVVASALGACIYCWGENQVCRKCQGKGKPGRFKPDREAFAEYVVPVVKMIRRHTLKTKVGNQINQHTTNTC